MSSAAVSICRCRSRRAVQRDAVRFLRCVLQNQETVPSHLFFARLFYGRPGASKPCGTRADR